MRPLQALAAATAALTALAPSALAQTGLEREGSGAVAGEAIVRFEPGTAPAERAAVRAAADVELDRALALSQTQVVEVDGSVAAAVRRLERQPDVAFAQPNYRYRAVAAAPPDARFDDLWGLAAINVLEAWDRAVGAGQVIAVVDTGVDLTHPDLVDRLWVNPDDPPNAIDDDLNGIADDVHGADFVDESIGGSEPLPDPDGSPDGDPSDFHYHGTHVAGTAAGASGNTSSPGGGGVVGVAPGAEVMAVRVLDGEGVGTTDAVAEGIVYAADEGADVINLSLGEQVSEPDLVLSEAINEASDAPQDPVVVAAAGNEDSDNDGAEPSSPCVIPSPPPNLLCVAAVGSDGQLADFSNWGAGSVDLAAPGVGVVSAFPDYHRVAPAVGGPFGFDAGLGGWTTFGADQAWEQSASGQASAGAFSATDSAGVDYPAGVKSSLVTEPPDFSLVGEQGCRLQYDLRLETALQSGSPDPGDYLDAGVLYGGDSLFTARWRGSSGGEFEPIEMSLRQLDGNAEIAPAFAFQADLDSNRADGAYVDEVEILCRDDSYSAFNYAALSGTSMAAPHVAGVAALAREVAGPSSSAADVVAAIVDGAAPLTPTPDKPTRTDRALDACRAVDLARGAEPQCSPTWQPTSSPPTTPPTDPPSNTFPTTTLPPGSPPAGPAAEPTVRLTLSRSRVTRSRRFTYVLRATGASGTVDVTRAVRVRGRKRRIGIARRSFAIPASGRVVLRLRLSKRQFRALMRNRRLVVRVQARVRGGDGAAANATRRLVLSPPGHRRP